MKFKKGDHVVVVYEGKKISGTVVSVGNAIGIMKLDSGGQFHYFSNDKVILSKTYYLDEFQKAL